MSPSKGKKTEKETEVDLFSMLPDDIIGCILSRLTMAEAVRSSVLGVRWRYLWTYYINSLDFDASLNVPQLKQRSRSNGEDLPEVIYEERERFRRCVDQVFKSLPTQTTVDSLRIRFELGISDSHVDNWVQFAIRKNVKKLHLNLCHYDCFLCLGHSDYYYCLVPSLLQLSTLQVLRLSCVDVSGEDLEYLLSSCLFLETLAVVHSKRLKSFKLCSSHNSKLKQLEIKDCFCLETLEISAANLVSFMYDSGYKSEPSINYKHIPNLKEVSFGGLKRDVLFSNFLQSSTYDHSSYLNVLKLTMISPYRSRSKIELPENLVLAALHHLELVFSLTEDAEYNYFVSLINRCPSLRTLTFMADDNCWAIFGMKQAHANNCLEKVKVIGFAERAVDYEFIECISKNAPNLKKLIIINPIFSPARTLVKKIKPKIPPYVELVASPQFADTNAELERKFAQFVNGNGELDE